MSKSRQRRQPSTLKAADLTARGLGTFPPTGDGVGGQLSRTGAAVVASAETPTLTTTVTKANATQRSFGPRWVRHPGLLPMPTTARHGVGAALDPRHPYRSPSASAGGRSVSTNHGTVLPASQHANKVHGT
ncbi:hypothetical protein [Chloroflexus sp.]|uniref:hypothetical protein n=1 Tax=Chloroflexus sp. TaxID=1904827 RepID=UPI0025875D1B|nr:hypothetical protein [Chloroflexus sp.]